MSKIIRLPDQEVFRLDELVKVRSGQVASMDVTDSSDLQFSLFAFDGGEGVSDEAYQGDTLYYVLSGTPVVTVDGTSHPIPKESGIVIGSGIEHAVEGKSPYQLIQMTLADQSKDGKTTKKAIEHLAPAEVLSLKEQVSYESNQVVSLTLARRPEVGLTLFAFDPGTKIGPHAAPGDALPFILEGEAEVTIGENTYTVKAGESIMMPAGIPHALKAVKPFKMLLVFVKS
ncbi:cupin domain-containing protein [Oscillospiraceae bacterium MB08-C2-2]|nr:cupin domain-containing protein [Oscillospiraceae bacterium MB08-C2-2]